MHVIVSGRVVSAGTSGVRISLPRAAIGDGVRLRSRHVQVDGVVTRVHTGIADVAPHGEVGGIAAGDLAHGYPAALALPLGTALLGRAIDGSGAPLDEHGAPRGRLRRVAIHSIDPAQRREMREPFWTGIRILDALLTVGRGARIGVFGAPGAGKSTLLRMLVQHAPADAVVLGLIGERGREACEWVQHLPAHAALICAPADRSACERVRAVQVAAAQACALRERGLHVLLILDSLARYAYALRELHAGAGEPVGRGGYPPAVFAQLAQFTESAGNAVSGSITMIATVLSDGGDRDPVSEAARSLLDGHIELSAALANAGRYPAIDVCSSSSRTMGDVAGESHLRDAATVRAALALLAGAQDARAVGILPVDPAACRAVDAEDAIESFLRQGRGGSPPATTLAALTALADRLR